MILITTFHAGYGLKLSFLGGIAGLHGAGEFLDSGHPRDGAYPQHASPLRLYQIRQVSMLV